ncbi:MAG: hypothetical protein H6713_38525 [Myxococcales bacterium]|nr:hypothetical protein [Myxococcales bacterium]
MRSSFSALPAPPALIAALIAALWIGLACQTAGPADAPQACAERDLHRARPPVSSSSREDGATASSASDALLDRHPSVADPLLLTTMALERSLEALASRSPKWRARARATARALVDERPSVRTLVALAVAIDELARAQVSAGPGVGPFAPDSVAWSRLEALADGAAAHVAQLELLGLTAPSLHRDMSEEASGSRGADRRSIQALREALARLPEQLAEPDEDARRRVEDAMASLRADAPSFPFERELRIWRDELRATGQAARAWSERRDRCDDGPRRRARQFADEADELVALLDLYSAAGC